ncbi:MAG TPA: metallopeptidase TldD-related protein [Chloroflexota bacterium]
MIGPERMLAPLAYAISGSTADQAEIVAELVHQGVTRYAGSTIHQTSVLDDVHVRVRAVVGQSVGQAIGNSLETAALRELVEGATAVAREREPDPEFVSLPEKEPVPPVHGFDAATAEMTSEGRAAGIRTVTEMAAERGWTASGTFITEGRELAVVSSLGVSAYAPRSMAFLRALPDSGKGTGYADGMSYRAADLDAADIARRALHRCELNHDQRAIPPGEYEAILGDLCVAEALTMLAGHGFNGQAYEEGRSFLSGRLGERVTGGNVTIWDDGTDERSLPAAIDYEGVPKRKVPLIEEGIARGVAYDSYTAQRVGKRSTGHSDSGVERPSYGPIPVNLFLAGGDATLEDMIRSTERGLLLTRFHYTHCPDPQRVVLTGTTRDGTFLIERGEIAGAVRNLRLTQSVPELFEGIEMLGRPRLCQDWWSSNGMGRVASYCPAIKVARAAFTSGTLF